MELAHTNPMHYTADGALSGSANAGATNVGATNVASFQDAMLKAMDGVSNSQAKSDDLLQAVVADPDSVDAQDVTIAMAEANMSLNLAKTVLSRIVTAWKDVINTR
jgi:flagellar hook-basal body complex protein FliE